MKKMVRKLFLLGLLALSSNAYAQQKGDMFVGGNIGFEIATTNSISASSFTIAPEFGYFVTKNLKIGASLEYGVGLGTHVFTVNPNVAYYVPITDKLSYTPQANIHAGLGASDGYKSGVFGFGLNFASFEYKPTNKFAITASLINFNYVYTDESHVASFDLLTSPTIGFRYYF